jgi:hypothetical protein
MILSLFSLPSSHFVQESDIRAFMRAHWKMDESAISISGTLNAYPDLFTQTDGGWILSSQGTDHILNTLYFMITHLLASQLLNGERLFIKDERTLTVSNGIGHQNAGKLEDDFLSKRDSPDNSIKSLHTGTLDISELSHNDNSSSSANQGATDQIANHEKVTMTDKAVQQVNTSEQNGEPKSASNEVEDADKIIQNATPQGPALNQKVGIPPLRSSADVLKVNPHLLEVNLCRFR